MKKGYQTKKGSLFESTVNLVIAFVVAVLSQRIIFPFFDIDIPFTSNIAITCWFTVISFVRSYLVRRFFNGRLNRLRKELG